MKYTIVNADGVRELREDSGPLPEGATKLSDADFDGMQKGTKQVVDGTVVDKEPPPPPPAAPIHDIVDQIAALSPNRLDTLKELLGLDGKK